MKRILPAALTLALALGTAAAARADEDRPIGPNGDGRVEPDAAEVATGDSAFFARETGNNLIDINLTNYGFFGNNFNSSKASFVYPRGATVNGQAHAFEHMVRGGIWFGALARDANGAFYGVTTGTTDGNQGSAGNSATEWTPIGRSIEVRSTIPTNPGYNPNAVSEEDFIAQYDDRVARTPAQNTEQNRPMGVQVTQESYSWSFADYTHSIIFHCTFKNTGPVMQDAWLGFYAEFASGDKSLYTARNIWPPTATGSPVGGWYSKKWIAYDDSIRLFREHYCSGQPIPNNCNLSVAPYWTGVRILGWRGLAEDTTTKKVTLSLWNWAPNGHAREFDFQRYAVMSAGTATPVVGDSLMPATGDPVTLMAVGPFPIVYHDSTVAFDFAIVGGAEIADIQRHSRLAQNAYNRGYIIPIPPPPPVFKAVAHNNAIDYYWDDSAEQAFDRTSPNPHDFEGYRIYVGEEPLALHMVGQFDSKVAPGDTAGFNTGFEPVKLPQPVTIDGVTYKYKFTVDHLRNGFKYFCAVTSYDLGTSEIESLESGQGLNEQMVIPGPAAGEVPKDKVYVFPNPYRVEARWDQGQGVRDHYLWFTNLPEKCTLRIFTLAGDEIFRKDFDGATYRGEGARGIYNPDAPVTTHPPTLSGTTYGWNMITTLGQAVATGLYMFSVEKPDGSHSVGKFLIVKSDREEF